MLQTLFTLKNLITQIHGSPMAFHNIEHAKHEVKKFMEAEQLAEETDPKNFELHQLGDFCNEEGALTNIIIAESIICNVSELILEKTTPASNETPLYKSKEQS